MNEITNQRLNELCDRYITGNIDNDAELSDLEFNELAVLYKNATASKEKLPLKTMFESKMQAFYNAAVTKFSSLEKVYSIAFNKNNMPIVDFTGTPFVFTDMDTCKSAITSFLGKNIKTTPEETGIIEITDIKKYYALFYLYGFNKIRLNEGIISLNLSDIAENPTENAITNPSLQNSAIFYIQYAASSLKYDNKDKDLSALVGKVMYELINGKYIIPAKKNDDNALLIPQLVRSDKTAWTPIFSDSYEFSRMYSSSEFGAATVNFNNVMEIYAQHKVSGIVLNPKGVNLILSKDFIDAIIKFKESIEK